MKKLIKDGNVAVIISPDFGAGWSTWNHNPSLLFDPIVVQMVLDGVTAETIEHYCKTVYGNHYFHAGSLHVEWIPQGTEFKVSEYDGAETIVYKDKMDWVTA